MQRNIATLATEDKQPWLPFNQSEVRLKGNKNASHIPFDFRTVFDNPFEGSFLGIFRDLFSEVNFWKKF